MTSLAFADSLDADADSDALIAPSANALTVAQAPGTTVAYDFSAIISGPNGNATNKVFVDAGDEVTVSIARSGDWLATDAPNLAGAPATFTFTAYDANQAGTIRIHVPAGTADGTTEQMNVELWASSIVGGGSLSGPGSSSTQKLSLNFNITARVPTTANEAPEITSASFGAANVGCRVGTALTVAFDDPDSSAWSAAIDWDYDGTTFDSDTVIDPVESNPFTANHTYNTPGSYTAAVRVSDDEGGTSDIATATITVDQTYALDFLPPFDDSTPSGLIVNKMKNGRVVPVKVTIYDECALAPVTSGAVTISVSKTLGTGGTSDPVESYADAGASSAGTNAFRFADGFWIYNLDSKALGLVTGNYYRVDVYVGTVSASVSNWAVLNPVK